MTPRTYRTQIKPDFLYASFQWNTRLSNLILAMLTKIPFRWATIFLHAVSIGQTSTSMQLENTFWPHTECPQIKIPKHPCLRANLQLSLPNKRYIRKWKPCLGHQLKLGIMKTFSILKYSSNYMRHGFNIRKGCILLA